MNPLYTRLTATGHDAEIKRSANGWRLYLTDSQGKRTGAHASCTRTGSAGVEAMNKRLRSPKGFRKDSQFHAALEQLVDFCEQHSEAGAAGAVDVSE